MHNDTMQHGQAAFHRLVVQQLKFCDRDFHAHHASSIYALARHPDPDNLGNDVAAMGSLRYAEFCEALGRLAMVWRRSSPTGSVSRTSEKTGSWPQHPELGRPVRLLPCHVICWRC